MSRSRRKTPIIGMCGSRHHLSEKEDKQIWHRAFRRRQKSLLRNEENEMPHLREYFNPWSMSKDGKTKFDPKKFPKYMRK